MERGFYQFLKLAHINSKEYGRICLGGNLYEGQKKFIKLVFDALEEDKHKIFILKARQLGISTITRALSVFYIGMHDGMQGALVFDTMPHRDSARIELAKLIRNLDPSLKFPRVLGVGGAGNRDSLQLENDARILFLSAGTQQRSTSGTLGRSEGLTMAHLSEICSFDNPEGLKAFEQSMSEFHPDRLYIYESTARGYNQWKDMWDDACADTSHCQTLFLGWWSREDQRIDQSDADFELYGKEPPSQRERERIDEVRKLYDVEITPEQLAWIRRKIDPTSRPDGDTEAGFETDDNVMLAEQAWTAEEAFQQTGSKFFGAKALTEITRKHVSNKFKAYMYWAAEEFPPRIFHAENLKMTELKVWEEPDPDGVYILACDPAYGENEENDHSAIQVCRCYADGLDQVAEYSWPLVTTYQLAWVIASLLGWYGQNRAEIRYILELNGPGTAVFNELKNLKGKIEINRSSRDDEKGIADIFRNVRTYIYNRPDSMGAGYNWHWVCLALDTKLPTPDGWTTMGEVKKGDWLYDADGRICTVIGTSPIHINHVCYKISFDDGTSIVADEDHLWSVYRWHWDECKLRKTKELRAGKHTIFVAKPLEGPLTPLPIHPYVLGVWLGDGGSAGGHFFAGEEDIENISRLIADCGYELGEIKRDRTVCRRLIVGLWSELRSLGLLGNKHIPQMYLRAPFSERMALLQGLMDTDGNSSKDTRKGTRQCSFSTSSDRLRDDFSELIRTLGFKAKYCVRENRVVRVVNDRSYVAATNYQFWFSAYPNAPMFRMERKQAPIDAVVCPPRQKMHRIVKIERVPSVPVKCLEVDSPTRLFLAGEGMVPTHNTNIGRKVLIMERLRDFVGNGKLRVRSLTTISEMKSIARDGDSIAAPRGMRDDRTFALALAVHYWETRVMTSMLAQRRTRESEAARKRLSIVDQVALFNQNHLDMFFNQKRVQRNTLRQQMLRQSWRSQGRRY